MVQVIDDERDVFAHIDADIVRSGEKLRCLVYQVGGQDAVDQTVRKYGSAGKNPIAVGNF